MTRLVWKELREKRGWALLLAASCLGITLIEGRFTFVGDFSASTVWLWMPASIAFLYGLGAFSSEQSGSASFLYWRPISWKKVMLAKVVSALVAVLSSVMLSAVVYRLIRPEQYAQVTTATNLAMPVIYTTAALMAAYLFGMSYSPPLPGVFGGVVTFIATMVLIGVETAAYQELVGRSGVDVTIVHAGQLYGWAIGPVVAAVVLARFGMTLSTAARALRYGIVALVVVAVVTAIGSLVPIPKINVAALPSTTTFSPDGRFALIEQMRATGGIETPSFRYDFFLLRLSDKKWAKLNWDGPYVSSFRSFWTDSGALVHWWQDGLRIDLMGQDGRVVDKKVTVFPKRSGFFLPSPTRRYALVIYQRGQVEKAAVVDVERAVQVGPIINDAKKRWWQSDNEVGYVDSKGVRHIVKVHGRL